MSGLGTSLFNFEKGTVMASAATSDDIAELLRTSYGIINRTQALAFGLTKRQIGHRVATREWASVHPGVYRHCAVAQSWHGDVLAAVLHTGGIASHRTAAALWGLEIYDQPPVELAVKKGKRSKHDVRLHQTTQWHLRSPATRHGIPCTGIERTLLDCAAVVSYHRLERLCEAAIRKRLTSWGRLITCLQQHSRQGRNGCGRLRTLLDARLGNGTIPLSDFSRLVEQLLRRHGVPVPILEYRITDESGDHVLQVDLAWPRQKKAWELDGLAFHFGRADIERDKRKRNRAKALGWSIQEILWSMYVDDPEELVAIARKFLRA